MRATAHSGHTMPPVEERAEIIIVPPSTAFLHTVQFSLGFFPGRTRPKMHVLYVIIAGNPLCAVRYHTSTVFAVGIFDVAVYYLYAASVGILPTAGPSASRSPASLSRTRSVARVDELDRGAGRGGEKDREARGGGTRIGMHGRGDQLPVKSVSLYLRASLECKCSEIGEQ